MARFLVSEDEWERRRGVVARFAESGLSMAEFARREGVAYAALLGIRPTNPMSTGRFFLWQPPIRAV
jgi:hypothetical protein